LGIYLIRTVGSGAHFNNLKPRNTSRWDFEKLLACFSRCVHMFATGQGLLTQTDETTDDGLKRIFATNLFGHFILVSPHQSLLMVSVKVSVFFSFQVNSRVNYCTLCMQYV